MIDKIGTHELVEELNNRLIKNDSLEIELDKFENYEYLVDQTVSGRLTPGSIEDGLSKMVDAGKEPGFLIIPQNYQMTVRRSEYFTSATRKYAANGFIGTYLDISVVVSSDLKQGAYIIEGDLSGDKTPEQICKILLSGRR